MSTSYIIFLPYIMGTQYVQSAANATYQLSGIPYLATPISLAPNVEISSLQKCKTGNQTLASGCTKRQWRLPTDWYSSALGAS